MGTWDRAAQDEHRSTLLRLCRLSANKAAKRDFQYNLAKLRRMRK